MTGLASCFKTNAYHRGGWGFGVGWGYPYYGYGWGYPYSPYYGYPYYGYGYPYVGFNIGYSSHHRHHKNVDDAGYRYWRVRNSTNIPLYVSAEGGNSVYVESGRSVKLNHTRSFRLKVEGANHANIFRTRNHDVNIMQDTQGNFMIGSYGKESHYERTHRGKRSRTDRTD